MCNSDHIQPKLGTCVEQKLHKKDSTLHADKVQSWKMTKYILKIFFGIFASFGISQSSDIAIMVM